MKTLELAVHVRLRFQTTFFKFGLHFAGVPRLDTPGNVVDQTGDSRRMRVSTCDMNPARFRMMMPPTLPTFIEHCFLPSS